MEQEQILSEVLAELKIIKQHIGDSDARIYKTEITLESINRSIESIENYKERIVKLEGSMHYLNTTLDKTNTTLEKLDATVDNIKEILTVQKGSAKTAGYIWEGLKWIGIGSLFPIGKALIEYLNR